MKTLILVDIQNDFIDGGALAVDGGAKVVDVANRLIPDFDFVVATQDWHPANHGSFASQHTRLDVGDSFSLNGLDQVAWPDHCVQGTFGAEFAPELNTGMIDEIIQKGTDPNIDSYSGFYDNGQRKSTGLAELLNACGVTEVTIIGLATDYCVKFTALDAIRLGFKTKLILDGCRGVGLQPNDIKNSINEMRTAGIQIK